MSLNSGLSQARQTIFPLCAFVTRRDWSEDASTAVAPLQQHNDTGGRLRLSHESGTPCQTMNVCIHDKRVLLLSRCSCDRPEGWWGVIFKPDVRGKYKFMLTFFEIDAVLCPCFHMQRETWAHKRTNTSNFFCADHHLSNGFSLLHMISGLRAEWGKFKKTYILFGWDSFSFPLITKPLLTDSQHSLHSHNVFLAFQTCRQTGWEKGGGE